MAEYRDEINQESFEQIESYLLGRMDTASRQAFEQAMANDELLRNEVTLQRKLIATVEAGSSLAAPSASGTVATPPAPVRSINRRWSYAAAAILILAAGVTWFLRQPAASKDLYTEYFRPDPGLPVAMSSTNAYTFYDGMVSYKEGNYKNAATMWEKLGSETGLTDTLQYFIGVARLNNNETPEATKYLLPVANNTTSVWKEKATWYLALSYIKANAPAEAVRWLTLLPNDERAKQLLAEPALQQAR